MHFSTLVVDAKTEQTARLFMMNIEFLLSKCVNAQLQTVRIHALERDAVIVICVVHNVFILEKLLADLVFWMLSRALKLFYGFVEIFLSK